LLKYLPFPLHNMYVMYEVHNIQAFSYSEIYSTAIHAHSFFKFSNKSGSLVPLSHYIAYFVDYDEILSTTADFGKNLNSLFFFFGNYIQIYETKIVFF
jgi:hypothetical protein